MPAESTDGRKRQAQYEKFLDMIGERDGTLPPYDLDDIVARHQYRKEQVRLIPASAAQRLLIEADRHLDIVLDHLLALMAADSTGTSAPVSGGVADDASAKASGRLNPLATQGESESSSDYPGTSLGAVEKRLTDRARKVLELALREALMLGHNYIATEHLLLAIVREGEGVGALALNDWPVRKRVLDLLRGYAADSAPDVDPDSGDWGYDHGEHHTGQD